jgi:glyoxylase-like metal-dependent hydrolase (beta-lactamase superfamily II)
MFAKRCLGVIVTHGHADHVGQTLDIVRHHRVPLYAQYELANFFEKQ